MLCESGDRPLARSFSSLTRKFAIDHYDVGAFVKFLLDYANKRRIPATNNEAKNQAEKCSRCILPAYR